MLLTEYETTLVVRPDIGGDAIEATLDRVRDAVKNRGGKLLAIDHWGKKKLAYPIMKHTRGIYVHTSYLGRDDLVTEVERNLRIADSVLRFLTVRVEVGVDPESRQAVDYEAPEYGADEAADEPEVEAASEDAEGEAAEAAPAEAEPVEAAPAEESPAEEMPSETTEPKAEE